MRSFAKGGPVGPVLALGLMAAAGCGAKSPPEHHFYDEHVQPIFNNFCVGNTSPCHKIDPQTKSTALGNLDLSSFEGVQKRRDVLRTYGSYPQPLLLLKAIPEDSAPIPYQGRTPSLANEIKHAGGKPIAANSDAFYELKRWLDNGANRDGIAPDPKPNTSGMGGCNTAIPAGVDLTVDTSSEAYGKFVQDVQPLLLRTCAFGTCHSSPQADLYLTCGDSDEQTAFNYIQAAGFIVLPPTVPEQSEILLRPLNPLAGGVSHTGGVFFESRDSDDWKMLRDWAALVQENPLAPSVPTAGEAFFEAQVMPKLLQRGCALEGCHSPDGFSDFRLRSGANGFFAPRALHRNYEGLLTEFMALDSVDVRQSRAVKKNIPLDLGGTAHRAGPILVDDVPIDTPCPTPFDAATNTRAFCVFKEWHRLEREAALAAGTVSAMPGTVPMVFVARPPNSDNLLQFDTYRGGADLRLADATVDATGAVTAVGNVRSALGPCAGLAGADADIRGPEWSYDGKSVVFSARVGAASGLDLWLLDVAGGSCRRLSSDNGRLVKDVRVHNFDPVFAPDGSVVFSSTRAGSLTLKTFQPNADLYRVGPDLDFGHPEQMTFLLNSEIGPAFMQDGRVSFTAEKATADFYQLSGRRINWDLSDYHPLLAQRARSRDRYTGDEHPSVGYEQATEIREGLDRNFLVIMSNRDAEGGGGTLATFNRSVGPFQADRDEVTFVRSVVYIDEGSTYRSPFSLPNGEILASRATGGSPPRFELTAVNERTGAHRTLASDPNLSYVEAALGYKRAERLLFKNTVQLVFGGRTEPDAVDQAVMHFPDLPVLATLLDSNLRSGRNVEAMDKAVALNVYEEHPPSGPNPGNLAGAEAVYTERSLLGSAKLESDKSLKVFVPARKPLILELVDGKGNSVLTMSEEHQVTPGEYITPGPPRKLFNPICGGCHGSLLGPEVDVAVSADALTGASVSISRDPGRLPKQLQ